MNDEAVDQADEEDLLSYEVSDEALEAAAGERQTATQFFICSSIWCQEVAARPEGAPARLLEAPGGS
jgi:hypothetical protein